MPAVKFKKLRIALVEREMTAEMLAEQIGMEDYNLSSRMTDRVEFRLSDMYKILDALGIDHSQMAEYFPVHGNSPRGAPVGSARRAHRTERASDVPSSTGGTDLTRSNKWKGSD